MHDKQAGDESFLKCMFFVERAATDERNFVKKGVVWALRGVGGRNAVLNAAVMEVCQKLIESPDSTAKWIGRTALRELLSRVATKRL